MSSGESILIIFEFYIDILRSLFDVLRSFEFLPGMSYLDFIIALVIIFILFKLIRFGVSEHYVDDDLVSSVSSYTYGFGPFSKTKIKKKSLKKKKGSR